MTPFWCAASPGLKAGEDVKESDRLARVQAVDAAIRAHYLSLPDKTETGWAEVLLDPRKYNTLWRHMLKHACGQHDLEINRFPPPIHLQHLIPGDRA